MLESHCLLGGTSQLGTYLDEMAGGRAPSRAPRLTREDVDQTRRSCYQRAVDAYAKLDEGFYGRPLKQLEGMPRVQLASVGGLARIDRAVARIEERLISGRNPVSLSLDDCYRLVAEVKQILEAVNDQFSAHR